MSGAQTVLRNNYDCRPDRGGCGALRGDYCVASSGKITQAHAARWDEYFGRASHPRMRVAPRRGVHREAAFNRAIRKLASRLDECRAILDELERHLEETDDDAG